MSIIKKNKIMPFSELHKQRYKQLYNYLINSKIYNDINEDTYITKKKRYLMGIIEDNKKWGDSSKKGLLFMCARFLNNSNEKRYSKLYSQAGYNLKVDIEQHENLNLMDMKEIDNIREYKYFNNILDNINYEAITTQTEHYKYLLLSMLILQPPVRTSFYTSCKFIRTIAENNGIDNYILINRRGKLKISYIINNDKASSYKVYKMNKNLSTIAIINDKLIKLINDSYIKYPRVYLFENDKNKSISSTTLLTYLRSITNITQINFNMMRSIYITEAYLKNINYAQKLELSHQMRHSIGTASQNYNKIDILEPENVESSTNKLNKKIVELQQQLKDCQLELSIFKSNIDDIKTFNKKKNDILYLIKSGKNVKASTLLKYNIT